MDSQQSFNRGLTEELGGNDSPLSSSYEQSDDLVRLYDACPRYIATVKKNTSAYYEFDKFRRDMYPAIMRRIARRLNMDDELPMSNGS